MLVECGFVRAQTSDGTEWSFRPSLARIAALGPPDEIVRLYVGLHGPKAAECAAYVLAGLCDQDDPSPLIGWHATDPGSPSDKPRPIWVPGVMPPIEQVVIARHLMEHGIVGKARPGSAAPAEAGEYSDRFEAGEYIAAARVHLGLSSEDAGALSMTELQQMLQMKFPDQTPKVDIPTAEEYEATMAWFKERSGAGH